MSDNPLTRRDFLKLVGVSSAGVAMSGGLGALLSNCANAAEPGRKPNVIIILADDLGYAELGCQGSKDIPTPNIDSIAKGGVRFTNAYVSCPVCSPTRAGLMTGRYQERFGHEMNPGPQAAANFGLPLTETTLAARMKSAGYATGLVGKWHLGNNPEYRPQKRGFDEFFGFLSGAHGYLDPGKAGNIYRGETVVDEKEYLTDAFGREAKAFINSHAKEPFFLYLAFNAVHSPLQTIKKYQDRFPNIKDEKRQKFAAMLSAMDDAVGGVLNTLQEHKLEENTLIFFLSDNGGPTPGTTSCNLPLRGYKAQVYEGGIRIPYMVKWKGQIPEGVVTDQVAISLDIAPTALAAAGAKADNAKFDGVNLLPYLKKEAKGNPHDTLYWRYGDQSAIRDGNWKLVKTPNEGTQLYDLSADISEKNDLASKNPDKLKELDAKLMKWDSELVAPKWNRSGGKGASKGKRRKNKQRKAQKSAT